MSGEVCGEADSPAKRVRKSEVVHVRVTAGERAALDAAAAARGEKLSAYLRVAGLYQAGAPGQVDAEAARIANAVKVLQGAANNLNQLAKAANRSRITFGETDRLVLLDLDRAIREARAEFAAYVSAARQRAGALPTSSKCERRRSSVNEDA